MEKLLIEVQSDDGTENMFKSWKKFNSIVTGIFTLIIIAVFPLFFHDYYIDILVAKYVFYYSTVIMLAILILLIAIFYSWKYIKKSKSGNIKNLFCKFNIKTLKKSDWAMVMFLVFVSISTLQSEYRYEAFWGNEGRFVGMFLMLLYGVSFFIITRCLRYRQWFLDAFLMAGTIACVIGILHFFRIDPLGFKAGLDDNDYVIFTSTIGNINTYTSYVALVSGMGTVMFSIEKNAYRRMWYLFTAVISLFALIVGISDNAYLALIVLFGLLPLYLFKNIDGVKRYVLMLSVLFTEIQVIDSVNRIFPEHVVDISGLLNVIVKFEGLAYLVVILWCITAGLYILAARVPQSHFLHKGNSVGRWLWLGIIVGVSIGIVCILYDANVAGNADKYGSLSKYLVLNDDWGTHRGYIWRIGMEIYQKFPVIHKIFGYGPDTFGILTVRNYYEDMVMRYNEKFDSIHNEYLQYLITIGIAGLIAYLSVIVTSVIEILKSVKNKPELMAIVFSIICYGAQAAVNISVPIVAPIMMTLLMVGVAAARAEKSAENSLRQCKE